MTLGLEACQPLSNMLKAQKAAEVDNAHTTKSVNTYVVERRFNRTAEKVATGKWKWNGKYEVATIALEIMNRWEYDYKHISVDQWTY